MIKFAFVKPVVNVADNIFKIGCFAAAGDKDEFPIYLERNLLDNRSKINSANSKLIA